MNQIIEHENQVIGKNIDNNSDGFAKSPTEGQKNNKLLIIAIIVFLFLVLISILALILKIQDKNSNTLDSVIAPNQVDTNVEASNINSIEESSELTNSQIILESDDLDCTSNNEYFVVKNNLDDSDLLVKYKTFPEQEVECSWNVTESDYLIENAWPGYYIGLKNNFLIIDTGTGPGLRGLVIYDLNMREEIFSDSYESDPSAGLQIEDNKITYWITSDVKPTSENCPKITEWSELGFGAAMRKEVELDINALTKVELGKLRCFSEQ